jgi:hypothetical protein
LGEDGAGQERLQQVQKDAGECLRLMAAAFGPAALLSKVLGDTLDDVFGAPSETESGVPSPERRPPMFVAAEDCARSRSVSTEKSS